MDYKKFCITLTSVSLNSYDRFNGKEKIFGEEAAKRCTIRDVRLVNDQIIAVTIKTSDSYAHYHVDYSLHFNGLKGAVS